MTEVTSYSELIGAIRDQVGRLEVRYEDFDALAGFASGLTGKAFGQAQVKRLGPEKLFDALRAAGLRLRVEEDPDQAERMRRRIAENFIPRQANQARMGNYSSPPGTHMYSRVFKHFAQKGGKARIASMSPAELREHQRAASNARWIAYRKKKQAKARAAEARKRRQREQQDQPQQEATP